MTTVHEWECKGNGGEIPDRRYRAVYDDDFDPAGSYFCGECAGCLRSKTHPAASECEMSAETRAKLDSGEWQVVGIIVSELSPAKHCDTCACTKPEWHEMDSLWGIVVENSNKAIETFARECM